MPAPRFVLDDFWPSDLFLGGIPGAWYDPTDLSTMFQDSAGTTPVTAVEQPVGLILDKSQGLALGAELVTNGDFSGGTTGWSVNAGATLSVSGGVLRVTTAAGGVAYVTQSFATTVGKTYRVEATIVTLGPVFTGVRKSDNATASSNVVTIKDTTGAGSGVFVATAATTFIVLQSNTVSAGQFAEFDNISVRELAGNHASQSTAASRPTYRARYNLLTYSEQFDNAAWTKNQTTVTTNAAVAPDGTTTADTVIPTVAGGAHSIYTSYTYAAGVHTLSMYAKANGYNWIKVASSFTGNGVFFDVLNGAVGTANAGYTGTIQAVGSGWFRCVTTWTAAAGFDLPGAYIATANGALSFNGDGTSGVLLWGAQLLTAADVTATGNAYQRIAAATVYDTAPVFRPYLAFDGLDDSLSTAAINFTSTDKMSVFSGVTKNSDSAYALIAELTTNADTFAGGFNFFGANQPGYYAQVGAIGDRVFGPGTPPPMSFATAAPTTDVVSLAYDRTIPSSVTQIQYRIDAQGPSSANLTLQGVGASGVFANAQLFIGRRNNSTFPFNGRLYSLIVRGAASSVTEIADTELWVNARTGGY